jgi:hypothetical protein
MCFEICKVLNKYKMTENCLPLWITLPHMGLEAFEIIPSDSGPATAQFPHGLHLAFFFF